MAARKTTPEGKKPDKFMRDALIVALHRECRTDDGKPTRYLYRVADSLVKKAANGDVQAIKEVFDRVEGRSPQAITGAEGGPIETSSISDMELVRSIAFLLMRADKRSK